MRLAHPVALTGDLFSHVVGVRAKVEMVWVAAGRVVTLVKDQQAVRDRAVVVRPDNPMNRVVPVQVLDGPVPQRQPMPGPFPTLAVRLADNPSQDALDDEAFAVDVRAWPPAEPLRSINAAHEIATTVFTNTWLAFTLSLHGRSLLSCHGQGRSQRRLTLSIPAPILA
jgi:hypothetical protein